MAKCTKLHCEGYYLYRDDGTPFFYLADTAWELFHRLNLQDAEYYLQDRASKGFTAIQAVVLAEIDGLTEPNANGDLPFNDLNTLTPNEKYFAHVDTIVDLAASLGMFITMLPSWGIYWRRDSSNKIFTVDSARRYGQYLGNRYRNKPIIWMLGGDSGMYAAEDHQMVDAIAQGLREGDQGEHLITYHPIGPGSSVMLVNDRPWLDFHTCQSSHAAHDTFNGAFILQGRQMKPARPILDAEPRYEHIPIGFYNEDAYNARRFDDFDARQAAYFSVFSGACGHTYGNNNIWQMHTADRVGRIGANIPWQIAIHHPGARQMGYLRKLMEENDFPHLEDANDLLVDAPRDGGARCLARINHEKKIALIYSPYGLPFGVDCSSFGARGFSAIWMNCKYGDYTPYVTLYLGAFQTFTPPTSGRGEDWILVIKAH